MEKIKILLVDDHQIFRDGVESLFSDAVDIEIIGVAGTGQEAIEKFKKEKADVVIMDISMPGISGIEAVQYLKKAKKVSKYLSA